ncbi:MerR family transcriptional regulator [Actinomycetaceae bacterium L2_0104]
MEWTIHQVAQAAGATSRTLRHYDDIGLLSPSRVGHNGYRYYDRAALLRLQRILLLRDLGMGLERIRSILARDRDELVVLKEHLAALESERVRVERQVQAVEHTIRALEGKEELMAETMFEGFDHTEYREEVEQRWGKRAYARSDEWWRRLSPTEKKQWQRRVADLSSDWTAAAQAGVSPDSAQARELARRHVDWLAEVPGTPAHSPDADTVTYILGLADMYVADERFAANYGGAAGAAFVRDALRSYLGAGNESPEAAGAGEA